MSINQRTAGLVALTGLMALTGCGTTPSTSGSTTTPTTGASSPAARAAAHAGLHVAHTSLGEVLVNGAGRTVYLLSADSPGHSTCASACAAVWPPVPPGAAAGVRAKVGHTTTPSGTPVATVGGWPLYTYAGDDAPGAVNGEGIATFGGTWYAVSANGTKVGAASQSTQSPGGSYGY